MRRRALEWLACPATGAALSLEVHEEADDGHVIRGTLRAQEHSYPIERGVPRLAQGEGDQGRTADRFGEQWTEFRTLDGLYEQQFLGWIEPNRPEDFRGKVVLEAGCGKGRHSILVSTWGAREVVALDLGSAVDVAFENCRHLENVHVVQADLRRPPVRRRSMDVGFSVGVLHHTPEPEQSFRALESRVRPGGRVIAWVYGRENNGWIVHGVDPLRMAMTSRLPVETMLQVSKLPAAVVWALSRGFYRPLSRGPWGSLGRKMFYQAYMDQLADFPFQEIHAIVHDHLTPPIAHYIRGPEFRAWFEGAGLEQLELGWHKQMSWRGTGTVPSGAA